MKTAQKIVNNLINENIFPLKFNSSIKRRWVIFEDNQFMSKHSFHRINPSSFLFLFNLLHLLIFYMGML